MLEIYCLIVILCLLLVVHKYHGLLNFFDPVSFSVFSLVLFNLSGLLYIDFISSTSSVDEEAALWLINGAFAFGFGILVGNLSFRRKRRARFVVGDNAGGQDKASPIVSNLLIGLAVIACIVYTVVSGGIVWGGDNAEDLRIMNRQGMGWLVIFISITCLIGVLQRVYYDLPRRNYFSFWVFVIFSSVVALVPGNRGPALEVVFAAFVFSCLFKWGRVPVFALFPAFVVGLSFLSVSALFRGSEIFEYELIVAKGL